MNTIEVPVGIKEVFDELARGHRQFISNNGGEEERNLFERIEQYIDSYNEYLSHVGYEIMGGDGFYYLIGEEDSSTQNAKIDRQLAWIQSLRLLTEALDGFDDGKVFLASDVEAYCSQNADMADVLRRLSQCGQNSTLTEQTDSLLKSFERVGFILKRSVHDRRYTVLSSINYLREIILSINIPE